MDHPIREATMRKFARLLCVAGVLATLTAGTSSVRPKCWICYETEIGLVCKSVPCP